MKNLASQTKSAWSKVLLVLFWIFYILFFLSFTILWASSDTDFFMKQYKSYNAAQTIGVSQESLKEVTIVLQNYLNGKVDSLDIEIERNGTAGQFFNQREKDHMVDVVLLFDFAKWVQGVSLSAMLFIFALLITVLADKDKKLNFKRLIKPYFPTVGLIAVLSSVIAFFATINFEKLWNFAHTLVFSNDLWLLDPNTDMLINLVPLNFFIAITTRIALVFGAALSFPILIYVVTNIVIKVKAKENAA